MAYLLRIAVLPFFLFVHGTAIGQQTAARLPERIDKKGRYLFYFHGSVVTDRGNNAVNQSYPEWGPYEYDNILDSLRKPGFIVISEIRRSNIPDSVYALKTMQQADSLLKAGVRPPDILLVGASAGTNIVLHAAARIRNKKMHFVIIGGCWPDDYKEYEALELNGYYLSIIEKTDPHGTCKRIFQNRKDSRFREIMLDTGLSHGFFYKGYRQWINPMLNWWESTAQKKDLSR